MEWSGRAPALPENYAGKRAKDEAELAFLF
jgi:hypothetical protein